MTTAQAILAEALPAIMLLDEYLACPNLLLTAAERYQKINLWIDQTPVLKKLQHFLHDKLYQLNFDKEAYVKLDLMPFYLIKSNVRAIATVLCFAAGTPFLLYDNKPYWEPLAVKLTALPNRTHGVGANPLHVDLLTRSHPPTVIAFLGIRSDPQGGGYTELSDLSMAVSQLSNSHYELLSEKFFKYWQDHNVQRVGAHLDCYAIIPPNLQKEFIRYTAKMVTHLNTTSNEKVLTKSGIKYQTEIKQALHALQRLLENNALRLSVKPNEILLFNQRHYAHSRTCLGEGQRNLPLYERRLLLQAYMHQPSRL